MQYSQTMLKKACNQIVDCMAYFNDLNHLVAEYDFDAEMQLYKIKKYLSKHNATMESTVFKTDQYEGRLAYLDREIERLEHLI